MKPNNECNGIFKSGFHILEEDCNNDQINSLEILSAYFPHSLI